MGRLSKKKSTWDKEDLVIFCNFYYNQEPYTEEILHFLESLGSGIGCRFIRIWNQGVYVDKNQVFRLPRIMNWVDSLTYVMNKIPCDQVFIWFDDLLPYNHLDLNQLTVRISQACSILKSNNKYIRYIRLNALPPATGVVFERDWKFIEKKEMYQCSLPGSIWNLEYLTQVIRMSSNIWSIEMLPHTANALSSRLTLIPCHNFKLRGHDNGLLLYLKYKLVKKSLSAWLKTMIWLAKRRSVRHLEKKPNLYHSIIKLSKYRHWQKRM